MPGRQDEDNSRQGKPPAADQAPGQAKKPQPKTTPGESQKSQIVQHFKSQGRQPDDVVWEFQGLKLRLRDLE